MIGRQEAILLTRIYNHFKDAFSSLVKNHTNTIGSIFIMSFTFAILGIVFIIVMNANHQVKESETTFQTIKVFLEDGLSSKEINKMYESLKEIKGVDFVSYESKEEAYRKWKEEEWKDDVYLLDGITESPLPNAFNIEIKDLKYSKYISNELKKYKGIETVKFYEDVIDKMLLISKIIEQIGFGVILVLLILCFFVISNTIKIAVNSRQVEINIMKYVGAKNSYIRWPFIIEGVLIGCISALISTALVYGIYSYVLDAFGVSVSKTAADIMAIKAVAPDELISHFLYIVTVLGIGVGALGSISSTRKHLRV